MAGKSVVWAVGQFGGRLELLKCMTVGPWNQGSSILSIDQTDIESMMVKPCGASPTD
jgi:hypothetical protein